MLKSSCLLSLMVLSGLPLTGCRASSSTKPSVSPAGLRQSSLHFAQETDMPGAGGGSFDPSAFSSTGFWPATPLVVPARAAAFIQETYGASNGFAYQSFEFRTTSCSAGDAFSRYFQAMEKLRGTPLSEAERSQIESAFDNTFGNNEAGLPQTTVCLLYDLMACLADYSVLNQDNVEDAAESGDPSVIMTGIASCVAEITGIDPVDTIVPFDPGTKLQSE